ncbi:MULTISPECIES: S9 family peptidase [unclassified Sphingomonas]|uniref:alpha/beta hydrolase family protein n=1 Tax=unclassified Sphingomonas TaxID=196159 RepID=UPI000BD1D154|nr:MAG: hypothetical protein B7Y98_14825 [Sphingomonas sp. 32-62-10]
MKKRNFGLVLGALATTALIGWSAAPAQVKPVSDWDGKVVPIETFAQFPVIQRPVLSPDGNWMIAKVRSAGVQALAIVPVGTPGKPEVIARDGEASVDKLGERQIIDYRWLDNNLLLIGFSSRDNYAGEWFDNVRYASYNRETKKTTPLGWDDSFLGTDLLWASNSGAPRILLQRRNPRNGTESLSAPEVIEVDAVTGKAKVAMRSNPVVRGWTADLAGVVRMGARRDADTGKVTVLYRDGPNDAMHTVYEGVPDRFAGAALPDFMMPDGKAYAVSAKDGYRALYTFDVAGMKLGEKVFGVDGYDIDGPRLSYDRTRLDAVEVTKDREVQVFFDSRLKQIQAVLENGFGKGNVYIASGDAKREKIVFRVAATGQAESWFMFNSVSGSVARLAFANETLKNAQLNPVSMVRYTASDGKSIEAVLTMPRHRAGKKNLPLIVLPHGGPWARDSADWDPFGWAQALAETGYVVIQPNFRGSTGYGTAWEKDGDKNWGYRMQDDLNDAVTWLAGQGTIDPKRVCMMGWSYGGYAASRAAERDGDKYRCAITGAGVHDLPAMVRYDKGYLGRYNAKAFLGQAGNLIDVSPGLHPENYKIPVLIIHGAKDVRVPVAQSRDLVARLKAAGKVEGKDFVYVEQPLNTHNLLREEDRLQVLIETKKFLEKHNPA